MLSPAIITSARRRGGLSQAELARRLHTSRSRIAAWETGSDIPSLERVREIAAACGLDLSISLANGDDSYAAQIEPLVAATPADRLRLSLRRSGRGGAPSDFDPCGALRQLLSADPELLLAGEVAEVLRGSPLGLSARLMVVPRDVEAVRTRLADLGAAALDGDDRLQASVERWAGVKPYQLAAYNAEVLVVTSPTGSHGYNDLRSATERIEIADGLRIHVCSLVDLLRLAEASPLNLERARTVALQATYEALRGA